MHYDRNKINMYLIKNMPGNPESHADHGITHGRITVVITKAVTALWFERPFLLKMFCT